MAAIFTGPDKDVASWPKTFSVKERPRFGSDSTESCLSEVDSCRSFSECRSTEPAHSDAEVGSPRQRKTTGAIAGGFAECGHMLELLICPGDLLFVQDRLPADPASSTRICIVMALPMQLPRSCSVAQKFVDLLPSVDASKLWLICVLEWSKEKRRLHRAQKVFYVESKTHRLVLVGDAEEDSGVEHSPVELRQSPGWLRANLRTDLMRQALEIMSSQCANAAAIGGDEALKPFLKAWRCDASSSCVGVVVAFWQLYLVALAESAAVIGTPHSVLSKWMPLMADRASLEELRNMLRSTGWISVHQIPILKQPIIGVLNQPAKTSESPMADEGKVVQSWAANVLRETDAEESPENLGAMDIPSDDDASLADLARTRGRLFRVFAMHATGSRLAI